MNSVVHFEIPYNNGQRAKKFYKEVFDWKLNDMPEMDYTIVHTVEVDENQMPKRAGAINGGMTERVDDEGPVLVIDVENIDDHLKKIEKAGGKVVMPVITVGNMGLYARVTDTEGNLIGIWQNLPQE